MRGRWGGKQLAQASRTVMVSGRSGPASSGPPRVAWFDPVPVPRENRRMSMAMPDPQGPLDAEDAPAVPTDRPPSGSEPSALARDDNATGSPVRRPGAEYG